MITQKETITNILSDNGWHCSSEFYAQYIADPRTRLCEIAKSGVELEWRWCRQHNHKKSKEWRLFPKVEVVEKFENRILLSREINGMPQKIESVRLFNLTPTFRHE